MKLLLVEDDERVAKSLVRVLGACREELNVEVLRAATLREAFEVMKSRPAAVITDWDFPLEGGASAAPNGHHVVKLCLELGVPVLVHSGGTAFRPAQNEEEAERQEMHDRKQVQAVPRGVPVVVKGTMHAIEAILLWLTEQDR